ncbi:MAG TPA: AIR synthase-related protein, partial [Actinomycetota bacterium]|nr:AIR synthase-related protein [Actinomycetota bacterium]
GLLEPGRFDLAGFCVGAVEEERLLGPHRVREGDALVGLASSGLHANGYALVRRALLEEAGYRLDDALPRLGRTLADELLEPTAIYAPLVAALARDGLVSAAAHVTGGGLVENLPRALPADLGAELEPGSWPIPEVFRLVQEASGASDQEMRSTFNLGLGMVLVVPPDRVEAARSRAEAAGMAAYRVGRVAPAPGLRFGPPSA